MDYFYLHGFGSSPGSVKAVSLADRLQEAGCTVQVPDLNQGDFSHLTLTRQIEQVERLLTGRPTTLIGSSLGGLVAAWLAERNPQVEHLVLLAPAFGFLAHWLALLGPEQVARWREQTYLPVYHYGEKRQLPLHYDFVIDAESYADERLRRAVPTLILHGIQDETIPVQASRDFAAPRPWVRLVELEGDHALTKALPEIWQQVRAFCVDRIR